jgi:transcription elongation GreA/GreB family factor
MEGRIQELSAILRNVQIIEEKKPLNVAQWILASHVTIQEGDFEEETYYM